MANLNLIRELCKLRKITLKELSKRVEISEMGLHRILKTNSVRSEVLEKISKELGVSPAAFFRDKVNITDVNRFAVSTLNNDLLIMLCNKFDSYFEKINTLKDYYVWKHVYFIIENSKLSRKPVEFPFPIKYKGGLETLLTLEQSIQIQLVISRDDLKIPYTKWPSKRQGLIKSTNMLEGFYLLLFIDNIFQIKDLLTDGLISDPEIKKYWEKWKSVELID